MKKNFIVVFLMVASFYSQAQVMTPEILSELNKINAIAVSKDGKDVIYSVSKYDIKSNSKLAKTYKIPVIGGQPTEINNAESMYVDHTISPKGNYALITNDVKVKKVMGTDFYPEIKKSNVYIYESLNYRHWDEWEDGMFSHLMLKDLSVPKGEELDLMMNEPFDCPQKPFGGDEDYIWNNDGTKILYVTKKSFGTAYAISTNTDIYSYDLATKTTTNLTEDNKGYDILPSYSKDGILAWLQMEEDGYESDKNNLVILQNGVKTNLTKQWDGTVEKYSWSQNGKELYFTAPIDGTIQLFKVAIPVKGLPQIKQITEGQFDITNIIGQSANLLIVTRTDMNHATEIYSVDLKTGKMAQITHANDALYASLKLSNVVKRMIKTTDGKEMLTWVIYPPDFDSTKKYPTLLYCQGGPQSALSQFYSARWNFQLMAANGYIVVAPNRRGMPGYGVAWNEQISGDWGGQNMQDYLSAIDEVSKEKYVDRELLGCIGASYGGYSVYYLAGNHNKRFKSFIAHDGVFNTRSMYGTTEELFFVNKDLGGPYWKNPNSKAYTEFNPVTYVDKWDTPIMIVQGGRDYRISTGQGLEAFQAAQLKGIKSKLLYFPEENHWVLDSQNGLVWQKEFYKWLKETIIK